MLDMKERKKERKKGLFYLIITISIIAAIVISCSDKPTASNDFAGFNENVKVDTSKGFTQFIGQTIRSKEDVPTDNSAVGYGMVWFWAEFDENGIKYNMGGSDTKPDLKYSSTLSKDALGSDNKANFSDANQGSIEFVTDALTGNVQNIQVKFLSGTSYNEKTIDCQFVNY